MVNKAKKGFTLVELLAVIVILAIILVIAVPQIMSVIEDSKKATLESTAKMIASAAEKTKIQNAVLGNTDTITCKSVAKLNDVDYESCNIEFDGNTAKVTIKGSGKFGGLNICGGTKTNAEATNEKCTLNTLVTHIQSLYASETSRIANGLKKDNTVDENIRYVGANPNNYVYFNCKDIASGISYGSNGYNYANACEKWRIIGIFEMETSDGKTEELVKLVRDAFTVNNEYELSTSWDKISQWGESTYEDGTFYEGANLMQILNGYYMGTTPKCSYCSGYRGYNCSNDCSNIIRPLSNESINMIETVVWPVGNINYNIETQLQLYNEERNEDLVSCTDGIVRTINWTGKIGLIYPSDWVYASAYEKCNNQFYTCGVNNWLDIDKNSNTSNWTISPSSCNYIYVVGNISGAYSGSIEYDSSTATSFALRPSLYLKSNVEIDDGDGSSGNPYKLKLS